MSASMCNVESHAYEERWKTVTRKGTAKANQPISSAKNKGPITPTLNLGPKTGTRHGTANNGSKAQFNSKGSAPLLKSAANQKNVASFTPNKHKRQRPASL
ncbi:hypothetical protein PIB30_053232 [Stylosanthes scabra]|uniref:Uncharacterized protein n=1 Tax=Stylosanthes scabra TaxID=79078 RepID=A0ABU6VGZ1_9FABA|nr:hypothetical protein [Stylosanthes scabra]